MKRTAARVVAVVAVTVMVLGAFATSAFALIDDLPDPLGSSATNPGALDNKETWWRAGWGHEAYPQFTMNTPGMDPMVQLTGFIYTVDSQVGTVVDTSTPSKYFVSANPVGTHINQTINIPASFQDPFETGPHVTPVGANYPYEGAWYLHYRFHDNIDEYGRNITAFFGVDRTAPAAVTGLKASPTTDPNVVGVSPSSRVNLTWDLAQYDSLSGVAFYQVLIDGQAAIPETTVTPTQGRRYELLPNYLPNDPTPYNKPVQVNSVTIEDAPAGLHTYSIVCVDRALNEGPATSVTFWSDPDQPTLSFVSPSGAYIGVTPKITVNAGDAGGVKSVAYYLDGKHIGTSTSAPYSLSPYLGSFGAGTHILKGVVTDAYGRTTTATKSVTLDLTRLSLTRLSLTPNPFFPILVDKYRDTQTVYFYANKPAVVTFTVRTSKGKVVRTMTKSVNAGKNKFTWDGKWSDDNTAHTGTFYYRISGIDRAAYTTTTKSLKTVIKNYQIKKLAHNKVTVIPR